MPQMVILADHRAAIESLQSSLSLLFTPYLSTSDIKQAFTMLTMRSIGAGALDDDKLNIHGNTCALGHQLSASSSQIIVSLIYVFKALSKSKGVVAFYFGGKATAIAF